MLAGLRTTPPKNTVAVEKEKGEKGTRETLIARFLFTSLFRFDVRCTRACGERRSATKGVRKTPIYFSSTII